MIAAALPLLACPHCGTPPRLATGGRQLVCPAGHAFDVARQGYVNLLTGAGTRGRSADTAAMVAARAAVQSRGCHAPIAEALTALVAELAWRLPAGGVLDVGGGTGYHAAALLEALTDRVGLTLDLSTYAARRATRAHPRLGSAVADAWARLPVRDGAVAVALSVFAPRRPVELRRLLATGGIVLVVTPRPDHLAELRDLPGMLGVDPDKAHRLAAQFAGFDLVGEARVDAALDVDPLTAARLVLMGPAAHHVDVAMRDPAAFAGAHLAALAPRVHLAVDVGAYAVSMKDVSMEDESMPDETLDTLDRWSGAGGVWRVLRRHDGVAHVGLYRCDAGEVMSRISTTDPEALAYLKLHPTSEE